MNPFINHYRKPWVQFKSKLLRGTAQGESIGPPNWSTWSGANDGTPSFDYTEEGVAGPTSIAMHDSSSFVAVVRVRSGTFVGRYAEVYTISGDTVTPEGSLKLSSGIGSFSSVIKMTDSRYLVAYGEASTIDCIVYILGKSGNTLTEEDVDTTTIESFNTVALEKISDTEAVLFYRSSGGNHAVVHVDITADSLSFGTPLVLAATNTGKYGGMCSLSSTEFMVAVGSKVFYITLSGSTFTLGDTENIDAGAGVWEDTQIVTVDSDTALVVYEEEQVGNRGQYANTFSVSGSVISRGTEQTVSTSRNFSGPASGKLISLDSGNFMFVGQLTDISTTLSKACVLNVDGSNNITVGSIVDVNDGDHPFAALIPDTGGARVMCVTQDSQTTPVDKLNFTVLKGDK